MSNPFAEKFKKTFANQRELGESVVKELCDPKITHILLFAPTQSGKTGSALSAAYFTQHPQYAQILRIPPENIFMLTGMSSNEWKEQTIERFQVSLWKHLASSTNRGTPNVSKNATRI